MKRILLILVMLTMTFYGFCQNDKEGKVIVERILSPSIQGNPGGENPLVRVSVYLPPDYDASNKRYPVIYYLHGFTNSDSLTFNGDHFNKLIDNAINNGLIKPMIVVVPNENNLYHGSFYTNSTLTGNWADFTAKDLVNYIDKKYRTIPNKNSRGVGGHSMGGHGTLKMGMLYPDVFGVMYAMSPAILDITEDVGIRNRSYKVVQTAKNEDGLNNSFLAAAFVAIGRAFSPNPNKPPFYCDFPYSYKGDSVIVNYEVLAKWKQNTPYNMVDSYISNIRKLNAIKIDWGRNEDFAHIPITALLLSKKLENYGIKHYAEEYIGTHSDKLFSADGRAYNEFLPFFSTYLKFEE